MLRIGRRGRALRPFCIKAGVKNRGYSLRLQRVMTDFGVECSFDRAKKRVQEHYGIEVPRNAVRHQTLKHARAINTVVSEIDPKPVDQLITQMDGCMVPVVESGSGSDRRKKKTLLWKEVRLCSARGKGKTEPVFGATLGSAEAAAWTWQETARLAGCQDKTEVHGVGDGATWIHDRFKENFGDRGRYLVDFYHASEYLSAAAVSIVPEKKRKQWRRRQQGRLLENQLHKVLRSMENYQEPEGAKESPVRDAYRYLTERKDQLDYLGARRAELPIGSGEIESAHRHVIQQRLKLAGAWWKETNVQSMLALRVARANNWWGLYWNLARN